MWDDKEIWQSSVPRTTECSHPVVAKEIWRQPAAHARVRPHHLKDCCQKKLLYVTHQVTKWKWAYKERRSVVLNQPTFPQKPGPKTSRDGKMIGIQSSGKLKPSWFLIAFPLLLLIIMPNKLSSITMYNIVITCNNSNKLTNQPGYNFHSSVLPGLK